MQNSKSSKKKVKSESMFPKFLKKLTKLSTQMPSGDGALSEMTELITRETVAINNDAEDQQLSHQEQSLLDEEHNYFSDEKPVSFVHEEIEKDKLTLDIELAVINILKNKQYKERLLKNREDELINLQIEYTALKKEQEKTLLIISEKNNEIEQYREWVSVQKLNYDQLAEDYYEFQSQALWQEEEIKRQLEREQDRYRQMSLEYETFKTEHMNQYNIIKEKLREKEIENKQLSDQNKKIKKDKEELLGTIQEFTARMSGNLESFRTSDKKKPTVKSLEKEETSKDV